ncbi:ATPase inhibitor, mitochondrial-like isoform X2 [Pungitius pungitius]|uniref:ATPase inhibitor, mitochondrial-like isoform X2 n=1 Tax=Pungitius pungitius TaxID=134920 RepID=UPI002E14ABB7
MSRFLLGANTRRCVVSQIRRASDQLGELGQGAGKGGGGGGSVRAAGGAFGKREVAEEERYFRKTTRLDGTPRSLKSPLVKKKPMTLHYY